jgi:hypothetical protein
MAQDPELERAVYNLLYARCRPRGMPKNGLSARNSKENGKLGARHA